MKYYTKEHQWVKLDGDDAIVGITGFAARELGDISYVELPREGSDVIVGDSLGIVEFRKVDVFQFADPAFFFRGTIDDAGVVVQIMIDQDHGSADGRIDVG